MKKLRFALLLHFLLGVLVVLFAGCADDSDDPVSSEGSNSGEWTLHESFFRDSKILLNGAVTNDTFVVAQLSAVSWFGTSSLTPVQNSHIGGSRALDAKPAIHGSLAIYKLEGDNQLLIGSANQPFSSGGFAWGICLHDYDSTISEDATIPVDYHTYPVGAFNDNGLFLTMVSDTSYYYRTNNSLCLINLNPYDYGYGMIELDPEILKIPLERDQYYRLNYIGAVGERFFVSLDGSGNQLLIVEPDGRVTINTDIPDRITDICSYNGVLYASTSYVHEVYYSVDQGTTWELLGTGFPAPGIRFAIIQDELCFYVYSQIGRFDLDNEVVLELDNTGLEGDEITSVNEFNGYVWITTLNGLYFKPVEDFFLERVVEQSLAETIQVETLPHSVD